MNPLTVLAPWEISDAPVLSALVQENYHHLKPWLDWVIEGHPTIAEAEELITTWQQQANETRTFVAKILWKGIIVGSCGVHDRIGQDRLEIGYWVGERFTGNGIAQSVVYTLCEIVWKTTDISLLELHIDEENKASTCVAQATYFYYDRTYIKPPAGSACSGKIQVWQRLKPA